MDLPPKRYLPGRSGQRSEIDLSSKAPQEIFRYGLDLYSFGYWWEAHEAWEYLWLGLDKKSVEANFLQGLIQLAAAFLKMELEQFKPARRLLETASKRFESAGSIQKILQGFGVD